MLIHKMQWNFSAKRQLQYFKILGNVNKKLIKKTCKYILNVHNLTSIKQTAKYCCYDMDIKIKNESKKWNH